MMAISYPMHTHEIIFKYGYCLIELFECLRRATVPEYNALGSMADSFPVSSLIFESQAQGIHGKEENEGERHHSSFLLSINPCAPLSYASPNSRDDQQ